MVWSKIEDIVPQNKQNKEQTMQKRNLPPPTHPPTGAKKGVAKKMHAHALERLSHYRDKRAVH